MNKYYFTLFSFLIFSCLNSAEETSGEIKEFITDAPPTEDSLSESGITQGLKDSLANYFTQVLVDRIDKYISAYNTLSTTEEFEKNYHEGMAIFLEMEIQLNDPKTEYMIAKSKEEEDWYPVDILSEIEDFNGRLGPIEFSCAAECTALDFLFDLTVLREKAKGTEGDGDDHFMNLVISMEGDYGYAAYPGFKSWFNQTWDLGGSSDIGNETLLGCIQSCQKFEKNYPDLFKNEIAEIHINFVDALVYGYIYSYDQETILGEYDKILKLNFFTSNEKKQIKTHYEEIKTGAEPFQFMCETGDCTYG